MIIMKLPLIIPWIEADHYVMIHARVAGAMGTNVDLSIVTINMILFFS